MNDPSLLLDIRASSVVAAGKAGQAHIVTRL